MSYQPPTVQTYKFGVGSLYGVSTTGSGPNTPLKFGALQDVSVDFSFTNKELHGQQIFPLAVARGTGKVSGKASFGQVNGRIYNDLFFGMTETDGSGLTTTLDEADTVPATTPFTVTVAGSANFSEDLGVRYANGGNPLVKVSTTPAQGQYSVDTATGVYTFNTADASVDVLISYTQTNTTGITVSGTNPLQGAAPTFSIHFATTYNSQQATLKLNACVASKLSLPSKMADWNIDSFDFDSFADSSGNVFEIYTPA